MNVQDRERIVVVGAGYGGVGTALRLGRLVGARTSIHLVDGRAEHQLITRLHEVAAGRLAPAAAAVSLRALLAGSSVHLHRAWVEGIDVQRGRVITSDGVLEYDRLVLAPGSQTDYRGVSGASALTLPLRTLEDALRVREKLASLLRGRPGPLYSGKGGSELAVLVVGGGYTGVELAAELADLPGRSARALRVVDGTLAAVGHPEVVVLGDAAAATDSHGTELPPSAQVAVQQAARVADNVAAVLDGQAAQPFVPRLDGEALSLGAHGGLAQVGPLALEDAPAVLVKKLAAAHHLGQLGGPALAALQCARQHLWDWRPQPVARLAERDTERAARCAWLQGERRRRPVVHGTRACVL
jgi:NADH dehydrogenase FAD-containing subunit